MEADNEYWATPHQRAAFDRTDGNPILAYAESGGFCEVVAVDERLGAPGDLIETGLS
jgi:hypothetical protein